MYKFMILAACVAYASAGVITGENSLVGESLGLSYAASAPIVRSSLSLGSPILGPAPLAFSQGALLGSSALAYAAPQQTIVRSAPLALSQGGLLGSSAVLSYAAPASLGLHAAPVASIVRSAPLALQAAPALSPGSLNIVRSAAPLPLQAAPALTQGSLNIVRSAAPLALQAGPALSQGSLNIVRSAPLLLNAGW